MRTITLMVFMFLSGACLGLLVGSTDRSQHKTGPGVKSHVFTLHHNPDSDRGASIEWGKSDFYFPTEAEFSAASERTYLELMSKVGKSK